MEKENYTAYDLEPEEKNPSVKKVDTKTIKRKKRDKEGMADKSDMTDASGASEKPDSDETEKELQNLIKEFGAAKIVELVRGNRNAAIKQILDEMQQQSDVSLQSGISAGHHSRTIFDLASQA